MLRVVRGNAVALVPIREPIGTNFRRGWIGHQVGARGRLRRRLIAVFRTFFAKAGMGVTLRVGAHAANDAAHLYLEHRNVPAGSERACEDREQFLVDLGNLVLGLGEYLCYLWHERQSHHLAAREVKAGHCHRQDRRLAPRLEPRHEGLREALRGKAALREQDAKAAQGRAVGSGLLHVPWVQQLGGAHLGLAADQPRQHAGGGDALAARVVRQHREVQLRAVAGTCRHPPTAGGGGHAELVRSALVLLLGIFASDAGPVRVLEAELRECHLPLPIRAAERRHKPHSVHGKRGVAFHAGSHPRARNLVQEPDVVVRIRDGAEQYALRHARPKGLWRPAGSD
mmetsp:Transcript_31181/g.82993  ORF Transcript_31181/g.82993 Transcript_31181/m.82993 type:complete len:341 (-) Transcript_31181:418-1440(-)